MERLDNSGSSLSIRHPEGALSRVRDSPSKISIIQLSPCDKSEFLSLRNELLLRARCEKSALTNDRGLERAQFDVQKNPFTTLSKL